MQAPGRDVTLSDLAAPKGGNSGFGGLSEALGLLRGAGQDLSALEPTGPGPGADPWATWAASTAGRGPLLDNLAFNLRLNAAAEGGDGGPAGRRAVVALDWGDALQVCGFGLRTNLGISIVCAVTCAWMRDDALWEGRAGRRTPGEGPGLLPRC